jgi:hypothetical protein
MSAIVIKSPTLTATSSIVDSTSSWPRLYKNIYIELYSGSLRIHDANTGSSLRTMSVSATSYSGLNAGNITVAANSTHYAVGISYIPTSSLSTTDHSAVYIYSIATGTLVQTITSNGHFGFGKELMFTDSKLMIRAPYEHGAFSASVYVYEFNPTTGLSALIRQIARPTGLTTTIFTGLKYSVFGEGGTGLGNQSGMHINTTYITIVTNDSVSSSTNKTNVYSSNGSLQRTMVGLSFAPINDQNLVLMNAGANGVGIYSIASGNLDRYISNGTSYKGITNEFAIVNNRLYELSSNTYFTNNTYDLVSSTHLKNSTTFYKF